MPTPSCCGITPCHWPQGTRDPKKVPRPPHCRDWCSHPSVPGKGAGAIPCITHRRGQQQGLVPHLDLETGQSSHHSPGLGAGRALPTHAWSAVALHSLSSEGTGCRAESLGRSSDSPFWLRALVSWPAVVTWCRPTPVWHCPAGRVSQWLSWSFWGQPGQSL